MDFLEIGKVVKSHGLKGRIKVLSYLESEVLLKDLDRVFIRQGTDKPLSFGVKSLQIKGRCFYLELTGVNHIDQAEELIGCPVNVSAEMLEKLPEGEYYWQELIGLEVVTEEGNSVGKLKGIFPTGSNDVYVCGDDEEDLYLPAIAEVVREIDLDHGKIVVRLPEGSSVNP